jgi:DNA-binding IscR family transcriptional regulator
MLCAGLPARIYESLKILCCLATVSDPLQAHEIASATDLPPAQTAKILQLMTWAGFVESRRGTKGGFWLVKPANRIRVTDVADFFAHHTPEKRPPKRDELLIALERATARCHKQFERITVGDLAKTSGCKRTGERPAAKVGSPQLQRKPKHRNRGAQRKTVATLVAVLLIVFAQVASLGCTRPECPLAHSASTMECPGMSVEMQTATAAATFASAERLPCCQLNNAQSDRRLVILPTHNAAPAHVVLQDSTVRALLAESEPVYRVDFSPPKVTSFFCTLRI